MIKNIMTTYKQMVESKHQCTIDTGEHESFKRILKMKLASKGYKFYSPYKTASSTCYSASTFSNSDKNLGAVYNLLNKEMTKSSDTEHICNLVKRQIAMYRKSKNFDF